MGVEGAKLVEHAQVEWNDKEEICGVSKGVSRGQIRGSDANAYAPRDDLRSDSATMDDAVVQAEREVWDIHNAGPLQRFAAAGLLVHNCLVLDHSDTTLRLGMVTDIDHDELDDGKPKPKSKAGDKEEKEKLPKECQECAGLIPYGAKECPCCGAVVRRPSNVEQRDGELVELTPGSMKPRGKRIPVLEQLREMGERSIYGQLRSLQAERDKSDGWVAANFKAVFDKWPPRRWDVPIETEEPSYALRSWIKARSIAYAKAMEAKNSARNGVML